MKYGRRACLVVGPRVALEPSANCSTACLFDLGSWCNGPCWPIKQLKYKQAYLGTVDNYIRGHRGDQEQQLVSTLSTGDCARKQRSPCNAAHSHHVPAYGLHRQRGIAAAFG